MFKKLLSICLVFMLTFSLGSCGSENVEPKEAENVKNSFILKGDICFSESIDKIETHKDSYVVCVDGVSKGVFSEIPEEYKDLPVEDYTGRLIIPGLTDLHIHAPQYAFRGTGMDDELLTWLDKSAFHEETKYSDLEYAKSAYEMFAEGLKKSATTHAVIFATQHREATELLMDEMEATGLRSYVGKVNMDREAPDSLREESAEKSYEETIKWLSDIEGKYENTMPILTPRFLPSCTDELLEMLKSVRNEYDLPVQSHLSENMGEVELVHKLFPDIDFYGEGYDIYDLFGRKEEQTENSKTVMAHCVYSTDEEIELMKKNNVFVAHCPTSNTDLSSGIAPIRRYIQEGLNVGLGTDVAGGHSDSMFNATVDAIEVSKLYWRLVDTDYKSLTFDEAFYLATLGGGRFFGNVGSFEDGYEFSAVVVDDLKTPCPYELTLRERVERAFYLSSDLTSLAGKYVAGNKIF